MASPKTTNPPAFGEILAGLGERVRRAFVRRPRFRRRRRRAQRSGDRRIVDSVGADARVGGPDGATRRRRGRAEKDRRRRSAALQARPNARLGRAAEPSAPPPEPEAGGTAASQSAGASGAAAFTMPGSPPDSVRQPAHAPAGGRSNPVHALWRLLGHIPGGWRVGAGVVASALAAARPARKRAAAASNKIAGAHQAKERRRDDRRGAWASRRSRHRRSAPHPARFRQEEPSGPLRAGPKAQRRAPHDDRQYADRCAYEAKAAVALGRLRPRQGRGAALRAEAIAAVIAFAPSLRENPAVGPRPVWKPR